MSHLLSAQGLSFHLAATGDTCRRTEPQCCERAAAGQKKPVSQPPWRKGVPAWAQTSDKASVHGLVDCLWPLVKASGQKEREREGEKPSLGQGPRALLLSVSPPKCCVTLAKIVTLLTGRVQGASAGSCVACVCCKEPRKGSTTPVLSLRDKEYKLFTLGTWLHQLFQLSSETPLAILP